jgi:hypothetical protein
MPRAGTDIRAGLYYTESAKSMGKRELLLMLGFLLVGAVVYTVTAPPADPADGGRSWSSIIDRARRGVRGNRASTEVVSTRTFEVPGDAAELRLALNARTLSVVGEARTDIEATVKVWSNGFDEAEAGTLARQTVLEAGGSGARISLDLKYPEAGSQRANVELKVPARLAISVSRYRGELTIANAAQVELLDTSGDAVIKETAGRVSVSHRGGELTIADAREVKVNGRGTELRLSRVSGPVTIQMQGGEVTASDLSGRLEIESNGTDLELERLAQMTGQARVTSTGGSLRIRELGADTRVDSRGTDVDVTLARPVPLGVYNEGQATIEVTPAAGGYSVDARASNGGRIVLPVDSIQVDAAGEGQQAAGDVDGGGPLLTLRTSRGDIVVRDRLAPAETGKR